MKVCDYDSLSFIETVETEVKWKFKFAYRCDWEDIRQLKHL